MARSRVHVWIGVAATTAILAVGSAAAANPPAKPIAGAGGPGVVFPLRASLSATQVASLQVASTATGRFIGGVFRTGFGSRGERPSVAWNLFWAVGVSNATGPITAVEIRSGEVGATAAGSAFLTLCSPCANLSAAAAGAAGTTLRGGTIRNLTAEQATALRRADLYVNVTTAANPAGELQGQVTRPKPVTTGAPPVTRMPNPIKPGPPLTVPGP